MTFHGRAVAPLPAGGVAVEVQALSHGRWRTIGRARSTAAGDWRSRVRVGGRRRFRARIGRQAGYPFVAGVSRVVSLRRR